MLLKLGREHWHDIGKRYRNWSVDIIVGCLFCCSTFVHRWAFLHSRNSLPQSENLFLWKVDLGTMKVAPSFSISSRKPGYQTESLSVFNVHWLKYYFQIHLIPKNWKTQWNKPSSFTKNAKFCSVHPKNRNTNKSTNQKETQSKPMSHAKTCMKTEPQQPKQSCVRQPSIKSN